ncbi:MAG: toll/interleukin-1 receptor domain-containing protein [Solirubrobacteraceae bacterium]|nr:toll/interleukin-1 receptor domain-containing protein [Solirubrobacteraceae bacterium]
MRVFISWSGDQAKPVAAALRDFLPLLLPDANPWMSDTDILAGVRWTTEIEKVLEESRVGVICVTRENQHRPWINFEAGAIAKRVGDTGRVVPLAIDLKKDTLSFPLAQFNAVNGDRHGIFEMVKSINDALDKSRPVAALEKLYPSVWDSDLAPVLEAAKLASSQPTNEDPRTERELLQELLALTRAIAVRDRSQSQSYDPIRELRGFVSGMLAVRPGGGETPSISRVAPTYVSISTGEVIDPEIRRLIERGAKIMADIDDVRWSPSSLGLLPEEPPTP